MYSEADWKSEKHVPVIECADVLKKGEKNPITVSVGKEITHPNTTAHFISWIKLYFHPEGERIQEIGVANFEAHGAGLKGADTSTVYTEPYAIFHLKTEKPGKLIATSYCNIHGLWKSEKDVTVG